VHPTKSVLQKRPGDGNYSGKTWFDCVSGFLHCHTGQDQVIEQLTELLDVLVASKLQPYPVHGIRKRTQRPRRSAV